MVGIRIGELDRLLIDELDRRIAASLLERWCEGELELSGKFEIQTLNRLPKSILSLQINEESEAIRLYTPQSRPSRAARASFFCT